MTNNTSGSLIRDLRIAQGWTQVDLANKTGISRTAVCAIEAEHHVPSVKVALALAQAFGTTVETLFGAPQVENAPILWESPAKDRRYWQAEISGTYVRYPATSPPCFSQISEISEISETLVEQNTSSRKSATEKLTAGGLAKSCSAATSLSRETLVLATCDPAAGLLATLFQQMTSLRILILVRSSSQSLDLLQRGLVHMAGLHYSTRESPEANSQCVESKLGQGFQLLRLARWQEGIATSTSCKIKSIRSATRGKLKWIGRESGSVARQCLDRLRPQQAPPQKIATNHRGVAEAIRSGWVDAGVCVQLASAEADLNFIPVQEEAYDVCFADSFLQDRRCRDFLNVIRSSAYRQQINLLPGYSTIETGELLHN